MKKKKRKYKGKRVSKGEKKISQLLDSKNIHYIREKTFEECVSTRNVKLRFDFYLPDYGMLIEYQGQHHYFPVNEYKRAQRAHQKTKVHDRIKKDFISKSDLELVEISYQQYGELEEIIDRIIEVKYADS